jgi:tetrapyrrole methylase family protein/MazG family protein
MTITIVGLGPGDVEDLTRRAWRALERASVVYLRTMRHPCVPNLPEGPTYESFDSVYETVERFEDVYATIVGRLLDMSKAGDVVYAVPGDPLVAESTVTRLLLEARTHGIPVEVISGVSFIEPTLALLGVDALDGLQLYDALTVAALHHPPLNPDTPALLAQVYSRAVASDVKLTLMNEYPDDFEVALIHAAGTGSGRAEWLPLYEMDRRDVNHLTSLYVPARGGMTSFEQFQEIIAHLRAPEGCPWDRKQTHESLRKYLIEESHEVLEAIDAGDMPALAEEMGDLMLQVLLHTQIAIEDGDFKMGDVLGAINNKLIRRHPHVFGEVEANTPDEVVTNWDALKKQEQTEKGSKRESLLDGVPKTLPALLQAHEYQAKAAKVHFDWPKVDFVIDKVREEIDEVLAAQGEAEQAEEMGDLLFVIVNWARWLGVEPETALREANAKFYKRFRFIEQALAERGRTPAESSLDEMDALWNDAKASGL